MITTLHKILVVNSFGNPSWHFNLHQLESLGLYQKSELPFPKMSKLDYQLKSYVKTLS
jgi:hypothetical protein